VFATSNNLKNLSAPLLSRFFIVELEQYTYEQFCEISNQLLLRQKVEAGIAIMISKAVDMCQSMDFAGKDLTHGIVGANDAINGVRP
jgi:ATP-dependent Lon protease